MFVVLDAIWGALDESLEAGYRHVLADYPGDVVAAAVDALGRGEYRKPEEAKWLPRPPEISIVVLRLLRAREAAQHLAQLRANIERQLLDAPLPTPLITGGADVA